MFLGFKTVCGLGGPQEVGQGVPKPWGSCLSIHLPLYLTITISLSHTQDGRIYLALCNKM